MTQPETSNANLKDHLEELCAYAIQRGASDAVVIPAADVIVDPRVRLKCMIPKCYMSGMCHHCPPYGYSAAQVQDIVDRYHWAVFFRVRVKSDTIAATGLSESLSRGVIDDAGNMLNLGGSYILVFTISRLVEKRARALGYPSPVAFAAGNCRDALCHLQPSCRNLLTSKGCRHPELSAPSMESCGMDAYTMAARAGWDVYPIGGSLNPQDVPGGSLMGLTLIT